MFKSALVVLLGAAVVAAPAQEEEEPPNWAELMTPIWRIYTTPRSRMYWSADVPGSVAIAQQTRKPLLFWYKGSSRNRNSDLEDVQRYVFSIPLIRTYIETHFVPARLFATGPDRQMLVNLDVTALYGLVLVAVSPEGELLEVIRPDTIARPERLGAALSGIFARYRANIFKSELRPLLEEAKPNVQEVRNALTLIRNMNITIADKTLIELIDNQHVRALRPQIYATLASLATKRATEALFKRALFERQARVALEGAAMPAARHLLDQLDPTEPRRLALAYDAAARITGLPRKGPNFWANASEARRVAEIEAFEPVVRERVRDWRMRGGALR